MGREVRDVQPEGMSWWARYSYLFVLALAVVATAAVFGSAAGDLSPEGLWAWAGPDAEWTPAVVMVAWFVALGLFAWPRRRQGRPIGVLLVSGLAALGVLGGLAAFWPWSGDEDAILTPVWRTLRLFTGDAADPLGAPPHAVPTPALQIARVAAIGATFATAALAALTLWRRQVDRLLARFRSFSDVVIGCDEDGVELVERLVRDPERTGRIGVLVAPGGPPQIIRRLRALNVSVLEAELARPAIRGLLTKPGPRRVAAMAVERIYIVNSDLTIAAKVTSVVKDIVSMSTGLSDRAVQIIVRVDDAERAWKIRLEDFNSSSKFIVDALVATEVTASEVLGRALWESGDARTDGTLVVCGDSDLTAAVLKEADRRYRESGLLERASAGVEKWASLHDVPDDNVGELLGHDEKDVLTPGGCFSQIIVLDSSATEIVESHCAQRGKAPAPDLHAESLTWETSLLDVLRARQGATGSASVVVITDPPSSKGWRVAPRIAQLSGEYVWYNAGAGFSEGRTTGLQNLHEFDVSLLFMGWMPDNTWSRIGRIQHERYRRAKFKLVDGRLPEARLPWWHSDQSQRLPSWRRRDNVDQARGVMKSIQEQGYDWVRVGTTKETGFEGDWEMVAQQEHARWLDVQLTNGFHAGPSPEDPHDHKRNPTCVEWDQLTEEERDWVKTNIQEVVDTVAVVGYVPVKQGDGSPAWSDEAKDTRIGMNPRG